MLVMALVGCKELTPCEEAAKVKDPELVIGLGEKEFEAPIREGQLIEPAYGSQGGRHLWLAVQTRGFVPGNGRGLLLGDTDVPTFVAELIGGDDGERYARGSWRYHAMDGDPTLASLALGQFVVSGLEAAALAQPLVLQVTGTDVCGDELVGEVDIGLTGMTGSSYY